MKEWGLCCLASTQGVQICVILNYLTIDIKVGGLQQTISKDGLELFDEPVVRVIDARKHADDIRHLSSCRTQIYESKDSVNNLSIDKSAKESHH